MKKILSLLPVFLVLIITACKKDSSSSSASSVPALPSITTSTVSNITRTSAQLGGNISSDGGASVTSRGICYNTSPNPTIANNNSSGGTGIGTFSNIITTLTANITYYVRAYAVNSVGIAYGNEVTFATQPITIPTVVTTTTVTTPILFNTTSGGGVLDDGGSLVTAKGVCWSSLHTPTIADSKTIDGSGTGYFSSSIPGLNANTNSTWEYKVHQIPNLN